MMEIKWLEDFLSLASTGNFSRSADLRNVTQPAFSRRIRALEMWAGVELIDRSTYPTKLTPEGHVFRETAEETLRLLYATRDNFTGTKRQSQLSISFTALHTLATSFFPYWLHSLEKHNSSISTRVSGRDLHDCVETLTNGDCDFMLCYAHEWAPMLLDPNEYPSISISSERFLPVSKPLENSKPQFFWPENNDKPIPFLSYARNCFLGKIMESLLQLRNESYQTNVVYENSMASALKEMAIEGFGFAWVPENLVKSDLESGKLVVAANEEWIPHLEIRLYRSKKRNRPMVEQFWKWAQAAKD